MNKHIPHVKSTDGENFISTSKILETFPFLQEQMKNKHDQIEIVAFVDALAIKADGKFYLSFNSMCKEIDMKNLTKNQRARLQAIKNLHEESSKLKQMKELYENNKEKFGKTKDSGSITHFDVIE